MVKNSLIESVVRQVILEYSGVSDEVMNISQKLISLLFDEEMNHEWKMSEETGDYVKEFLIPIHCKAANYLSVRLFYYNHKQMDFKMAKEVYSELGVLLFAYNPKFKAIKLHIPFPDNGIIDEDSMKDILSSINHEVKHGYQANKRGYMNVAPAYTNSVKSGVYTDNDTDKNLKLSVMRNNIKGLYYAFDTDEVDAWLQEVYIELLNNGGDLSKSRTYVYMMKKKESYNWLKNKVLFPPKGSFDMRYYADVRDMFKQELEAILGVGITPKEFFHHCESGLKRFEEHVRRVIGRYRSEYGAPSGSFANYAKNEVPQSGMFKNGGRMEPEFLRKLRRGYNRFRYGLK